MLQAFSRNCTASTGKTTACRYRDRIVGRTGFATASAVFTAHEDGVERRDRVHGTGIPLVNGLAFPEMPSILLYLNS